MNLETKREIFYCTVNNVDFEVEILEVFGEYEIVNIIEGEFIVSEQEIIKEYEAYKETQRNEFSDFEEI